MLPGNLLIRIGIFLLLLGMVFVIHEHGHMREFQKQGIAVEEFSIGIGPAAYQYQTADGMTVSLRIIPVAAYVKPTEAGGDIFLAQATRSERLAVYLAGIRNHLFFAVAGLLILQLLGWRKGNLTTREFAYQALCTPVKLMQRAGAFYLGCLTFGQVNKVDSTLLSTGRIHPPPWLGIFIALNIGFAFFNILPIPGLDGYKVFVALGVIDESLLSEIPRWLVGALIGGFVALANLQDLRMFETQS